MGRDWLPEALRRTRRPRSSGQRSSTSSGIDLDARRRRTPHPPEVPRRARGAPWSASRRRSSARASSSPRTSSSTASRSGASPSPRHRRRARGRAAAATSSTSRRARGASPTSSARSRSPPEDADPAREPGRDLPVPQRHLRQDRDRKTARPWPRTRIETRHVHDQEGQGHRPQGRRGHRRSAQRS